MKKIIIFAASIFASVNSFASDILSCDYAKAPLSKDPASQMVQMGKANVEFDGKSFKAYRSDGSFTFTPPLTTPSNGMLILDDKTKVFAAASDKSSFAISDRIGKTTEQWANCTIINKEPAKPEKVESWKYRNLTTSEKKAVESAIRDQLKDPDSAKFKHSKYVSNGKGAYCGLVNSKNSYGGYAGDTPFMVMIINNKNPHAGVIALGGDSSAQTATITVCRDNGYF